MRRIDDGSYHKVANIVGGTMKFHPHGDASIEAALVYLANKELFIDKQGNFGSVVTGDRAAAARYIEARLSRWDAKSCSTTTSPNWSIPTIRAMWNPSACRSRSPRCC